MKGKRRKPSAAARVRPFWMVICVAVILLAGALVFGVTYSGFDARYVSVSGNNHVSRSEILERAAIAPNVSIWLQNTAAIAHRLEGIPYVATARVGQIPPATMRIRVVERAPFAVIHSGYDDALVDRSLRVLEEPVSEATALPVFVVQDTTDLSPGSFVQTHDAIALRDAYQTLVGAKIAPAALAFDRFGGLVVTLHGGMQLLLGTQNDLARKLTLANAILAQVVTRRAQVSAIDLRAPSAPVLVYR